MALSRGEIDAVAFGKDFIANPDLVKRYQLKASLNAAGFGKLFTIRN